MARLRPVTASVLLAVTAGGCTMFGDNRLACRWSGAGTGFVAGGLIGGFAVNAIDLSSTAQGGATVGGVLGGGALGAVIGAIASNYTCPPGAPAPPPPPAAPTPPDVAPGAEPPSE